MEQGANKKILLCGTKWGRYYILPLIQNQLETFISKANLFPYHELVKEYQREYNKRSVGKDMPSLQLKAILAKGSTYSRSSAKIFEAAYYMDLQSIDWTEIDMVCVIISEKKGGNNIVQTALKRGIPVLMEHPVSCSFIESMQALALKYDTLFWVNYHYAFCRNVQDFIDKIKQYSLDHKSVFLRIATCLRNLWSVLDIVGRALGQFKQLEIRAIKTKFLSGVIQLFEGTINDIPVLLMIQDTYSIEDKNQNQMFAHLIEWHFENSMWMLPNNINNPSIYVNNENENTQNKELHNCLKAEFVSTEVDRMVANRLAIEMMLSAKNDLYLNEISHQRTVAAVTERILKEIKPLYLVESSMRHPLYYLPKSGTITRNPN